MINLEDFQKAEIRIGKVKSVEKVEGADKLLKFIFDMGTEDRQILSGIAEYYTDLEALVGKEMAIIVNLEPRVIRGHESQGMVLAAVDGDRPVFISPEKEVTPGSIVR